jgi:hypothetical protein
MQKSLHGLYVLYTLLPTYNKSLTFTYIYIIYLFIIYLFLGCKKTNIYLYINIYMHLIARKDLFLVTYLPIGFSFYKNRLQRWNLTLTQLGFIHNWVTRTSNGWYVGGYWFKPPSNLYFFLLYWKIFLKYELSDHHEIRKPN